MRIKTLVFTCNLDEYPFEGQSHWFTEGDERFDAAVNRHLSDGWFLRDVAFPAHGERLFKIAVLVDDVEPRQVEVIDP